MLASRRGLSGALVHQPRIGFTFEKDLSPPCFAPCSLESPSGLTTIRLSAPGTWTTDARFELPPAGLATIDARLGRVWALPAGIALGATIVGVFVVSAHTNDDPLGVRQWAWDHGPISGELTGLNQLVVDIPALVAAAGVISLSAFVSHGSVCVTIGGGSATDSESGVSWRRVCTGAPDTEG